MKSSAAQVSTNPNSSSPAKHRLLAVWAWLGSVRQWHWVSSALCLVSMLLFAVTGITLNHAGQVEANAQVLTLEQVVPQAVLDAVLDYADTTDLSVEQPLPAPLRDWLAQEAAIDVGSRAAEWEDGEVYLAMPRPGGDAWLSLDTDTGELLYESTSRGAIAYLNDLHKGRNTGLAWSWFLDVFSVSCVVFCLSGLILLQRQARSRPATWPAVGFGLVLPALLALLFIH